MHTDMTPCRKVDTPFSRMLRDPAHGCGAARTVLGPVWPMMVCIVFGLTACGEKQATGPASSASPASNASAADGKGSADHKASAPASGADPLGMQAMGDRGTEVLDKAAKGVASLTDGGAAMLGRIGIKLRDEDARASGGKSGEMAQQQGAATASDAAARAQDAATTARDAATRAAAASSAVGAHVAGASSDAAARVTGGASDVAAHVAGAPHAATHMSGASSDATARVPGVASDTQARVTRTPSDAAAHAAQVASAPRDSRGEDPRGERAPDTSSATRNGAEQRTPETISIPFLHGKSTLSPETAPLIDVIVNALKNKQAAHAVLCGHADNSGTAEYNRALTLERARAVRDRLVARGIDPSKLSIRSRFDTTEAIGRDAFSERRVDVILTVQDA